MSRLKSLFMVAANLAAMVAANFRGDLKISDQNNWGGTEQKIKFEVDLNLRGDLKF